MARRKTKPHWYRIIIGGCPICGRYSGPSRERVYGKKPKEPAKRYEYLTDAEAYDYCDVL